MTPSPSDDDADLPAPRADRAVTLAHRFEYVLTRVLFAAFRALGVERSSALAGGFMRRIGPMLRPVSRRAEDNLRLAYPNWDERRVRKVTAGVWENLGRTAAEFARLEAFLPDAGRVEIANRDRFRAYANGAGQAIFVSGHFANWEVMPITMHAVGLDYVFVYRPANNPLVDRLIIETRGRVMSRRQAPKGKQGGRALVDALRAGRSLAMLVDQKLNDGIAVPFMGREAMTAPAAARLSLKFGAPIVPVSLERLKGARFRLTVNEPIAFSPSGALADDVRALTILVNAALERDIRARPEQWLWLHRRWPKAP